MRFVFADCVLDLDRYELRRGGTPVSVQPKVLALLQFLLERRERAVTKSEILDALWRDTATTESSLTRAVSLARSAIGERERDAGVIRTVRGRGYRIGVPVTVEDAHGAPSAPAQVSSRVLCRDKELEIGRDALDASLTGHGQVVLLAGEPGIGKTRLAAELANTARGRGASVFWGRCDEGEIGPAYWPWVQILRGALEEWGADSLVAAFGVGEDLLAAILPELREGFPDLTRPQAQDRDLARFRLFDGLARLLRARAAHRPIALILDDLHCGDEPSLALLGFLSHELADARIFVVGTYRDGEVAAGQPLQRALAELARSQRPRNRILLRGLSAPCVRRFIETLTGSAPTAALVESCMRRSEGNPLFLLELLQWLEASETPLDAIALDVQNGIPEGVRQVIGRRLALVSAQVRQALEAASVLGRDFSTAMLARVLGQTEAELLACIAEAERARILLPVRGQPGELRFSHGLVAEVLYDELETGQRMRLHARVAEELERRFTPHSIAPTDLHVGLPGSHLAELAHHLCEAGTTGDPVKAASISALAADYAVTLLDFPAAARHLGAALHSLEAHAPADASRWFELALALTDARYFSGDPGEAGEMLWRIVERARASGDAEALGQAGTRLAEYKIGGNVMLPVAPRLAVLEEAALRMGASDGALHARVLAALGSELSFANDPDRADGIIEQGISLARRAGDPVTLWHALFARRLYRVQPWVSEERLSQTEELLRLTQQVGDRRLELLTRIDFSLAARIERGERAEIDHELECCGALATELRQPGLHWLVLRARAGRSLWQGRLAETETLLDEALVLGQSADRDIARLSYETARLPLRRMQGRFAELERGLGADGRLPRNRGHKAAALCLLLAESGRKASARVELEALAANGFAAIRRDSNYSCNLALLAEACVLLDDKICAVELRERLVPYAGRYVALQAIAAYGCASRFLGLLAGVLGEWKQAVSSLEEALSVEERMGARPYEAYALRDLAFALESRDGVRARAASRELRVRANRIASELGLANLEQARR